MPVRGCLSERLDENFTFRLLCSGFEVHDLDTSLNRCNLVGIESSGDWLSWIQALVHLQGLHVGNKRVLMETRAWHEALYAPELPL